MTAERPPTIHRGRVYSCAACKRPVPDGAAVRVSARRQVKQDTVTANVHCHRSCAESFQQAIGDALSRVDRPQTTTE